MHKAQNMTELVYELADALWTQANQHGHKGLELEFRFGHMLPGGHFSANIGKAAFQKLKTTFDAIQKFDRVVDIETVEKIADVKHVTTLALAESSMLSSTPKPPPPPFCMTKQRVFQKEFTVVAESPYTIRANIALEKIVPLRTVISKLTRHKKRRRYIYKCWAYDFTEVVSNGDIDMEESYEIELELVDPGILFEKTMDYLLEWGLTLVCDIINVLKDT